MTYPDFSIGGPIDPPGLADGSDRVPAADADGFVRYHLGDAGIFFGLAESRHVDSIPAGDVSYQAVGTAFTLHGFFLSGENLQIEADGSISGEIDSFRFFAGQEHYVMGNDFRLAFSSWQGPVRWEIGGAGTGKELSDLMVDAGSAGEWRDLVDSGGGLVADWATGLHRLMRDYSVWDDTVAAMANGGNAIHRGLKGDDDMTLEAGAGMLKGGHGDDTLSAVLSDDPEARYVLVGGGGNDVICYGTGHSIVRGGSGNDVIMLASPAHAQIPLDTLDGAFWGQELILDPPELRGHPGNAGPSFSPWLPKAPASFDIDAGSGSDTIYLNGTGHVRAGSGNDRLIVDNGYATTDGGSIEISLGSGADHLEIMGHAGRDITVTDFDATEDHLLLNGAPQLVETRMEQGNFIVSYGDTVLRFEDCEAFDIEIVQYAMLT